MSSVLLSSPSHLHNSW